MSSYIVVNGNKLLKQNKRKNEIYPIGILQAFQIKMSFVHTYI